MTSAPSSTQIRGDQSSSGHRTRLNSPLMSPERMPRLKPASRLLSCQISQAAADARSSPPNVKPSTPRRSLIESTTTPA